MNLHEHQAKTLLSKFGVPVPRGFAAYSVEEAKAAAGKLGAPPYVVKAQIHAGGRGKGGGVKVTQSLEELEAAARAMLGMTLVTHQTGPKGRVVHRLLIEEGAAIERELYLSMLVDRRSGRPAVVASTEGGMDIEEVAASAPEKIVTFTLDPATGPWPHHAALLAKALELSGGAAKEMRSLLSALFRAFTQSDLSLLEINPLIVEKGGSLMVLDAKLAIDDNALYRHPDLAELRDPAEEDAKEIEAGREGLSYIALEGEIGCMVNGAGLAMATMDIIKLYGAEPANFLDVGGGASKEKVAAAFKIITSDPNVKGILVNIFGGIMRCD
ncbi:MAG: ADP-forming succinate--CoA ligase subunit beta, partial [Caulobacteraceae bacterium]